jgi:putative addiction module component (TIGR02574 family)
MIPVSNDPEGEAPMASVALDLVRSKALELSEAERAELAHDLVASLDGEPDPKVADEWDAEILRRLRQIDNGTAEFVDRSELKRRMRQHLVRD